MYIHMVCMYNMHYAYVRMYIHMYIRTYVCTKCYVFIGFVYAYSGDEFVSLHLQYTYAVRCVYVHVCIEYV